MNPELYPYVNNLLGALLVFILAGAAVYYAAGKAGLFAFIEARTAGITQNLLLDAAVIAVQYVEQYAAQYLGHTPEAKEKRELAIDALADQISTYGIKVSREVLGQLVESAVLEMNGIVDLDPEPDLP